MSKNHKFRLWHAGQIKESLQRAAKAIAYAVGRNHPHYQSVIGAANA